jgi:hypothetical protein
LYVAGVKKATQVTLGDGNQIPIKGGAPDKTPQAFFMARLLRVGIHAKLVGPAP